MKRQITQFDNDRTNATVATPTCSSCCCCCCCLTTAVTSSTLLAMRINKQAKSNRVRDPSGLTLLAALFIPVIAAVTYLIVGAVNKVYGYCLTDKLNTYSSFANSYQVCSKPADTFYFIAPVGFLVTVGVLYYLYRRVRMHQPVTRSVFISLIVWVAFIGEGIGGAILLLTGIGGPVYLCLVPVLFGLIVRFYYKKVFHMQVSKNVTPWRLP